MHIEIICVGKLKEPFWKEAVAEYLKRLSRYSKTTITEVGDLPAGERLSPAQENQIKTAEGEKILNQIHPGRWRIALDMRGKQMNSPEFASYLARHEQEGHDLAFLIGGSLGLSHGVLDSCQERISLGKMTWPHQIARILLLEQIYRGYRIMHNEPYHK